MDGDPTEANHIFTIEGNLLKVGIPKTWITNLTVNIGSQIQSKDQDGLVIEEEFEIIVSDGPEAPSNILLSNTAVPENSPAKTKVGDLLTVDPDGEKPLVELTADDDTLDNEKFHIYRGQLKTNDSFNHEVTPSFLIRLTAVDETGLSIEKDFTIEVSDIPEAPEGITLGDSTINENLPSGSIVGQLTPQDPDTTDEYEFKLISGDGDANNNLFSVERDELKTKASFDYETKALYSVRIQVQDSTGATWDGPLIISVLDANDPPDEVTLDNLTVVGGVTDQLVGSLSGSDVDTSDNHVFSLVGGEGDQDNSLFKINANKLMTSSPIDGTSSTRNIRIRATDKKVGS